MKDLIKKQDEEFDKEFEIVGNSFFADDMFISGWKNCEEQSKTFIAKVRKETVEYERKRILKEVRKIDISSKFMNTIDRGKVLRILKELK